MSNSISAITAPPARPAPEPLAPARVATAPAQAPERPQAMGTEKAQSRPDPETARRELKQAVERLNQQAQKDKRKISFSMDDVADRVVITVRKSDTGEVIRQIPDESLLRVAHNIAELKGLLHNETT